MSSPSSSSSSSQDDGGIGSSSSARRRGSDFEGPSSSRRRGVSDIWPEPFLEALAVQVAIDASRSLGRLAAAAALANIFRVCSTWREVSRSEMLWHRLTRRVWGRTHLFYRDTWRDEFIYWHLAAANFRARRCSHRLLHFEPSDNGGGDENPDALSCRRLTISDSHLACGFADGAVRLFDLATRRHVRTIRPRPRNVLGQFSRAVTGVVLPTALDRRLVFATLDGDVHVAAVEAAPPYPRHPRRAQAGHVVDDGVLVDFAGCARWWVGLYAGVPGRAFHVWDGASEELLFVGGSLTDPESVTGWQMLIQLNLVVGRIRVTGHGTAVACTSRRAVVFDLRNPLFPVGQEEYDNGLMATSLDVSNSAYVIVDNRGVARVRRAGTLEELCSFTVRRGAWQRGLMGAMNQGHALMCGAGGIRAWETERGRYLYRLTEEIGEVSAVAADERYVVASASDATLHLWDFGPQ